MPGAGKQPPEVQQQIQQLLEAGFDPTTIHRRLKVGRSSIYRMKRCLAQHGTPYMPTEFNKKNGRPKVLTADQELQIREWLRDPKNRDRYLDDLVWLCHDRFGIVCSTTTMSKLKRKWLRVIECEETGMPLDDLTRELVMETHPDSEVLSAVGLSTTTVSEAAAAGTVHDGAMGSDTMLGGTLDGSVATGESSHHDDAVDLMGGSAAMRMASGALRQQQQMDSELERLGASSIDPRIHAYQPDQDHDIGTAHALTTDPQLRDTTFDSSFEGHIVSPELERQIRTGFGDSGDVVVQPDAGHSHLATSEGAMTIQF